MALFGRDVSEPVIEAPDAPPAYKTERSVTQMLDVWAKTKPAEREAVEAFILDVFDRLKCIEHGYEPKPAPQPIHAPQQEVRRRLPNGAPANAGPGPVGRIANAGDLTAFLAAQEEYDWQEREEMRRRREWAEAEIAKQRASEGDAPPDADAPNGAAPAAQA